MWDELDDVPFELTEEQLDELIEETIEEVLEKFRGYEDPFWYSKKSKKHHEIPKPMVRVQTNPGTQPDREIRWKNYPKQAGTNHMEVFFKEWK